MRGLAIPASIRACLPPARNAPWRFGKPLPPRQIAPPTPRLARGSAITSSRAFAKPPVKSNPLSCSSASPLVFVQQTAQLIQLFLGRSPGLQRMAHQFPCRTLKHSLQHVPNELPLRFCRRLACFINVRPLLFVSSHRALSGHNLQQLQPPGVAQVLLFTQRFVHLANRGRPA